MFEDNSRTRTLKHDIDSVVAICDQPIGQAWGHLALATLDLGSQKGGKAGAGAAQAAARHARARIRAVRPMSNPSFLAAGRFAPTTPSPG